MLVIVIFDFFFFFKQKTAYEMRISDWSSDVCSSDLRIAEGSQPAAGRFQAGVVEAEAVDHRAVLGKTEDAEAGIAGLWARRHRAHLDEAEAEAEHGGHRARILVEAGGKAERVAERQAPERRGEKGIVVDGAVRSEPALQGPEGQAMRALRIEPP